MKTSHIIYTFILVSAAVFANYDLSNRISSEKTNPIELTKSTKVQNEIKTAVVAATESNIDFKDQFKNEIASRALTKNDLVVQKNNMKAMAKKLKYSDIENVYEIMSDEKNSGEYRAMAVELLSVKNDTASLTALQNFVGNNTTVTGTTWNRKKEFETILRAQAVESIAAFPQKEIALSTLGYLQRKVDEKFLMDRIGRATVNLRGQAATESATTDEALTELVK